MPSGWIETAGETIAVRCQEKSAAGLITRAVGAPLASRPGSDVTVSLDVETATARFDTARLTSVTRDCWSDGTRTVLANACGSGFDLQIEVTDAHLAVTARYRPPAPVRGLNTLTRRRFSLLAGQTLVHYPVLWRAGWRGRVPLHAGVLATTAGLPLLVGPSGVGKSTVIGAAVAEGAAATSDNLCCGDGSDCFGLAEPLRLTGGAARRTSHGRSDTELTGRVGSLMPDRVVVLARGRETRIEAAKPDDAARSLVAGTYAAGELRRYWQFAATLALATGRGPAHPPVHEVAAGYTDRLPCLRVQVGDGERSTVAQLCGELS